MKKFALLALIMFTGCVSAPKMDPNSDLAYHAVSITAQSGGGGSGVVLKSTDSGSIILTNRHICVAIAGGGTVTTQEKMTARVADFKASKHTDLCVIRVNRNLHINTKVATREGRNFEKSYVAGHPYLFPTMVVEGHFSGFMDVTLMTGAQKCDGNEVGDDEIYCDIYGMKPVIQTFESQAISNLIAPGNSGSAVFNDRGEVTNLIFAGAGGISPGLTIPNGQIRAFLTKELKGLTWMAPNKEGLVESAAEKKFTNKVVKIVKK